MTVSTFIPHTGIPDDIYYGDSPFPSGLIGLEDWFEGKNRVCPDGVYTQSRPLDRATGIHFYQGKSE